MSDSSLDKATGVFYDAINYVIQQLALTTGRVDMMDIDGTPSKV
jgi:hypothetical protein